VGKLLKLCPSVDKWKLCIRSGLESWNHPSGTFTLLGDSVHAMLPSLASGAGMCIEDDAVLGECLSRIKSKSTVEIKHALEVYQAYQKPCTKRIVARSTLQQHLAHLPDREEQRKRYRMMRMVPTPPGEALVWRDPVVGPWLLGYDHVEM